MIKRLLILALICTSFAAGYGAVTHAWPYFGRNEYRGYFGNVFDSNGTNVLPTIYEGGTRAIPNYVDSAAELIAFIQLQFTGSNQQRIGAGFIVDTMLGGDHQYPPSNEDMAQWQSDLYFYEAAGWINWNLPFAHGYNSLYQGTGSGPNPNDDAFFTNSATSSSITFTGPGGWIRYGIRRECANPVGTGGFVPLEHKEYSFDGYTTVSNANPAPGTNITFRHYVVNNGPSSVWPNALWWIAERTAPGPLTLVGGPANDGYYDDVGNPHNVFNHVVTIPAGTAAGTQFCERVGWTPVNSQGAENGRGTPACAIVSGNYNLVPAATANASTAQEGDTVQFTYRVTNNGTAGSPAATCSVRDGAGVPVGGITLTCGSGQAFPASPTAVLVGTENFVVPAGTAGTSVCRLLYIAPGSSTDANHSSPQVCVLIVNQPYARVYGGDVSAGNGLASGTGTCSTSDSAIVGWNKRSAGSFAGAGAQYAAYAINVINDFATALGNAGGAPVPHGLAFANTSTDTTNGIFGGSFGSLSCITDHYGTRPATTSAIPASVSSMTTGSYGATGNVTLSGGNINPNNRISVYVDGNVFIGGNISYPGSWDIATMPQFRLIVRGNIFIGNNVSQLDGLYVAQRNGAIGGTIYTCAVAGAPYTPLPLDGTLHDQCDNAKLTVNGAFIANQVQLLRTRGSLSQSTAAESGASGFAGEVFNYSPALWLAQPSTQGGGSGDYDAIISLPPVL